MINKKHMLEALIGLSLIDIKSINNEENHKRDRIFGKSSEIKNLSDKQKIIKWHERFGDYNNKETARRYTLLLKYFSNALIIFFFFIGISAAGVLFHYDGSSPINILPILFFFAFIPFCLLSISIIYSLLGKENNLPLLLQNMMIYIVKAMPIKNTQRMEELVDKFMEHSKVMAMYFKRLIQKAGLSYVLGASIWILIKVSTTDLAFSWSSTLELSADHIYSLTKLVSLPWYNLFPAAVIDYDIVKNTQYFRADQSDLMSVSSGRWWSFLFMSILTYSYIPRIIAYLFYNNRFNKMIAKTIVEMKNSTIILASMNYPIIETKSTDKNEVKEDHSSNKDIRLPKPEEYKSIQLILWNYDKDEIAPNKLQESFPTKQIKLHFIGGLNPTNDDEMTINTISREYENSNRKNNIFILVKYWESPDKYFEIILMKLSKNILNTPIYIIPGIRKELENRDSYKSNWQNRILRLSSENIFFYPHSPIEI